MEILTFAFLLLQINFLIEDFAVSYPIDEDKARRVPEARNASTIVYRQDEKTRKCFTGKAGVGRRKDDSKFEIRD